MYVNKGNVLDKAMMPSIPIDINASYWQSKLYTDIARASIRLFCGNFTLFVLECLNVYNGGIRKRGYCIAKLLLINFDRGDHTSVTNFKYVQIPDTRFFFCM